MHKRFVTLVKFSTLALAAALTVGCATRGETDKLQADIDEARRMAEQAQGTASEAKTMAARAEERANEGVACCNEVREGMDRMFKRSMRK
jgi:hypothetical protein